MNVVIHDRNLQPVTVINLDEDVYSRLCRGERIRMVTTGPLSLVPYDPDVDDRPMVSTADIVNLTCDGGYYTDRGYFHGTIVVDDAEQARHLRHVLLPGQRPVQFTAAPTLVNEVEYLRQVSNMNWQEHQRVYERAISRGISSMAEVGGFNPGRMRHLTGQTEQRPRTSEPPDPPGSPQS